jgi:hypothetical protein
MKKFVSFLLLLLLGTAVESAPFQNLGFDVYDPSTGLLPGWHVQDPVTDGSHNTSEGVLIGVDQITAGLNYGTLIDTNISLQLGYNLPVSGQYSLGFWPGFDGNGSFAPFSLTQTGDVPADAKSIHFVGFGGAFELRVNHLLVPLVYDNTPGTIAVNVYGDMSAFAGQTVELDFTTIKGARPNGIDSILFSPQIVPEPTTCLFFGLGWLGLLARRKIFR